RDGFFCLNPVFFIATAFQLVLSLFVVEIFRIIHIFSRAITANFLALRVKLLRMDNIKPIHGEPLGKRLYEATDPLTGALINMYLLNVVLTILKIVVITPYFTDSLFRMGVFLCVTVLSILFIVKLLKKPSSVRTFYHAGLMVYVSYLAISIFFL